MEIDYPLHVTPTGGTVIVDDRGTVIAVATRWEHAANIAHAMNTLSSSRRKIDGLDCVPWIKKYREDNNVTLKAAKDEWDRRIDAVR